jgi:hypothetical protein
VKDISAFFVLKLFALFGHGADAIDGFVFNGALDLHVFVGPAKGLGFGDTLAHALIVFCVVFCKIHGGEILAGATLGAVFGCRKTYD